MAVQISDGAGTPHATDYADLLSKLKTFALANGWTSLEDSSDKLVLQGEGSGSDEIIVAFQKYANAGSDSYGWYINGYTAYLGSGTTFYNQPGAISTSYFSTLGHPVMPLWNSTIPYWFVVSGRRIVVVAKVSTTYQACYAGFFLPFAPPTQYPYPLAVGGSAYYTSGNSTPRYSGTTGQQCMFWQGDDTPPFFTRNPGGYWSKFQFATGSASLQAKGNSLRGLHPYVQPDVARRRNAIDGSPILTPVEILDWSSDLLKNRLGEIDGVFHIPGFGQVPESIVTVDSVDYLVIPNVYRQSDDDFAVVKLA